MENIKNAVADSIPNVIKKVKQGIQPPRLICELAVGVKTALSCAKQSKKLPKGLRESEDPQTTKAWKKGS